ncbi:MAG: sulfatase-like hydrolase/transferase, partial [Desulfobacterales bacterium]
MKSKNKVNVNRRDFLRRATKVTAGSVLGGSFLAGLAKASTGKFKGKIAKRYEDSVEWWPEPVTPPKGAPNVIIFLLDDVGFAQIGCFGGLIDTPNIDRLAKNG